MFEQKKLSEVFHLNPETVRKNHDVQVFSSGRAGSWTNLEKAKPWFSFVYEEVVPFVEYLKRSYVGLPLVIESPLRGGKSDFARQVCLRLNVGFRYFNMKVTSTADLMAELERLFGEAREQSEGDLLVVHLDNVDEMPVYELKTVVESFNGQFHGKFRVVLSAEEGAPLNLPATKRLHLSPLCEERVVDVLTRYVDASFELDGKESLRVSLLAKTIAEVCDEYFSQVQIEWALAWLNEAIVMLSWDLNEGNVCVEALRAIKHCVTESDYESIVALTQDNIGKKLKIANAK